MAPIKKHVLKNMQNKFFAQNLAIAVPLAITIKISKTNMIAQNRRASKQIEKHKKILA